MQQILLRTNAFTISVMIACLSAGSSAWAQELDKVTFGAAWVAEAAHGGFYQAVAGGTYRKHGLDVTIVQGARRSMADNSSTECLKTGPQYTHAIGRNTRSSHYDDVASQPSERNGQARRRWRRV